VRSLFQRPDVFHFAQQQKYNQQARKTDTSNSDLKTLRTK
jgi:hypothetical protein